MSEEDYIAMIYESLSGSLSNEKQQLLDNWLLSSTNNQALFKEISSLYALEESFRDHSEYDAVSALAQVKSQIRPQQVKNKTLINFWRVAAAAALLFGCWYFISSPDKTQSFAANESSEHYQLIDGSQVWLQPGSAFTYSMNDGTARMVKLEGSAYFDVAEDPEKSFIVLTEDFSVEVLGTEFAVNATNSNQPQLVVNEGKVRIATTSDTSNLIANQYATLDENKQIVNKNVFSRHNLQSWKTNRLTFRDTPIEQVIVDLQRHYNIAISFKDPIPTACPVTAIFVDESLKHILEHINNTTGLVSVKTSDAWEISGNSCN